MLRIANLCLRLRTPKGSVSSNQLNCFCSAPAPTEDPISKLIEQFSTYRPSSLTIQNLLDFGTKPSEHDAFCFLRSEIPVRLSNMIKEMDHLPKKLLENRNVKMVREWYVLSFKEVVQYQKENEKDPMVLRRFRELLPNILNRHSDVVPVIARGVMELRNKHGLDVSTERQIHYFLDRFYMSKISIRMLQHQHILLFSPKPPNAKNTKNIGAIDPNCDVTVAFHDAYEDARHLCENNYNNSPKLELEIYKMGKKMPADTPVSLIYVPSHIHHILFELIKNAMRAEAEKGENFYESQDGTKSELAPLRAIICQGRDDITIRVSDRGGGIPRRNIKKVFNYAFTTAKTPVIPGQENDNEHSEGYHVPMAGYGYGLPLARLYARYFNGDISLASIDGYGTDAYVFLRNLPTEASELLPAYTRAEATRAYDKQASPETSHWLDASRAAAHAATIIEPLRHEHS